MGIEAPRARPAATVALVRNGPGGIETWMMRRAIGMPFASGAVVFPGGRVDEADADPSIRWHGDTPERLATRLRIDVPAARAVVTAAVRELFEEAGVLLTAPAVAGDVEQARAAVESRAIGLSAWLAEQSCALDVSRIRPWGRWVTPAGEPRRFDTWFFVAAMSAGAEARAATSEAVSAGWFDVEEALDRADKHEMLVLPPTIVMLRGLLAAGTVEGVLAAATTRSMEPVHPVVRHNSDGTVLVQGGGEDVLVRP
jgi:8-oxo-dGTP pyrophosphatase MutT (NUDIX family)